MKRLSDDPAVRLAECRGEPVPPAGEVEVLPERKSYEESFTVHGQGQIMGWNACLRACEPVAQNLTAERDALKAEVEKLTYDFQVCNSVRAAYEKENRAMQSELTKARGLLGPEFIAVRRDLLNTACNGYVQEQGHALNELREILARQSAPAVCPKCGDTGEADIGGVAPWGERISIPCDCQSAAAANGGE